MLIIAAIDLCSLLMVWLQDLFSRFLALHAQRLRSFYSQSRNPAACFVQAGLEDGDNLYVKLDELTLSLRKRGGNRIRQIGVYGRVDWLGGKPSSLKGRLERRCAHIDDIIQNGNKQERAALVFAVGTSEDNLSMPQVFTRKPYNDPTSSLPAHGFRA